MRESLHRWITGNRRPLAVLYLLAFCSFAYSLLAILTMHAAVIRYVSQTGGTFSGGSACNGQPTITPAAFNTLTNGPGDHDFLCGTISSAIVPTGNGGAGSPVTITFDAGASIQAPALPTTGGLNLSGLSHYLIDGGGGNCGFINQTSNITCGGGFIESTANGSGLANQIASVGINAGSTTDIEIKGLLIGPIYLHTSSTDISQSAPGPIAIEFQNATTLNVHNDTIHDCAWCLTGQGTTLSFTNLEVFNVDHGVGIGGTNSAITVCSDHFHDYANWDQSNNAFHHDGVHLFSTGTNTFNGATVCNDLFDGDQGGSVTAPGLYAESASTGAAIENITAYNLVVIMFPGRLSCCGLISFYTTAGGATATNGKAYNNTMIGYYQAGTGACFDAVGWTNITWENNVVRGCQSQVTIDAASTITLVDNNDYDDLATDHGCGLGCNTFSWHGSIFASFATWKTDCSCDSHGRQDSAAQVNLNSTGQQLSGSTLIGAGANLTALSISGLNSDFLLTPRPGGVTAWDMGGFFGIPSAGSGGMTITPSGALCAAGGCQ